MISIILWKSYGNPRCQARHRPMWSRPSGWELPAMAELGKIHRWMASPLENIENIWGIFKLNWSEKFFSKLLIYVLYLSLSDFACLSRYAWNIDTLRIWVAVDLCIALRPLTAFREVLADVLDRTSDPKMEHQMGGVRVAQDLICKGDFRNAPLSRVFMIICWESKISIEIL